MTTVFSDTNNTIIARKQEIAILERMCVSNEAQFLAVYGRRRIGKTYLISQFFKNKGTYFELTGTKGPALSAQLKNFRKALADVFYKGTMQEMPGDWRDAFEQLCDAVKNHDHNKKIIIFLDELPWLAGKRSDLLPSLEHAWNRYLSRYNNVILVICGSSASWMIRKVIYNTGGLYGRLTAEMHLKPFTLGETELYLQAKGVNLNRKQIVELYLAFGGVAKYLNHVTKGDSSAQIIAQTCFAPSGALTNEFPKLFDSLFDKPEQHLKIVYALANKKSGMTQEEILKATSLSSGGTFTGVLEELKNSGFIDTLLHYPNVKRKIRYQLVDEYSLFYLTWIKPALNKQMDTVLDYWQSVQKSQSYTSWAGYAFESVCLKHINKIIAALKISAVAQTCATWSFSPKDKESKQTGVQIDLVIDRTDDCINLCEIKFYDSEFYLSKEYAENLKQKKLSFLEHTKTKKSLFTTLITSYGVSNNQYYLVSVDNDITMDALF